MSSGQEKIVSLQTACPICHTVFKVDEHQLASAQGMVQCGICGMVFNARQHLKLENIQPNDVAIEAPVPVNDIAVDVNTPEIATSAEISEPASNVLEQPTIDDIIEEEIPSPIIDAVTAPESVDTANAVNNLPIIQFKKQTSPKLKAIYATLAAVLTSGLILQLGLQYKDQLSAGFPALLPIYGSICDGALCSMSTPYDVSQIALTSSSFEIDPKHKDQIIVTLDMTNNAEMALQYPRIALTLLDNAERVISVKNLSPHNYLLANSRQNALMPHDDVSIRLLIAVDADAVAGYKIKLF